MCQAGGRFSSIAVIGKLCETMDFSYFWKTGKQPSPAKDGITHEWSLQPDIRQFQQKQEETSCQAQLKNHLRLNQREGTLRKRQNQKFFFLYKEANAKPTSKHDKFNRFPRDPKCEIHNMTKTMCARCQK